MHFLSIPLDYAFKFEVEYKLKDGRQFIMKSKKQDRVRKPLAIYCVIL